MGGERWDAVRRGGVGCGVVGGWVGWGAVGRGGGPPGGSAGSRVLVLVLLPLLFLK